MKRGVRPSTATAREEWTKMLAELDGDVEALELVAEVVRVLVARRRRRSTSFSRRSIHRD